MVKIKFKNTRGILFFHYCLKIRNFEINKKPHTGNYRVQNDEE